MGFPNILQFSRLNAAISSLKSQSEEARIEIVTGRAADLKQALGGAIGGAQLLRKSIDEVSAYQFAATRALGRASAAQITLARAADQAGALGPEILSALGRADETSLGVAADQAKLDLNNAISSLNQRYEGKAMFAGDATDSAPLADAETLLTDIRAIFAGAATPAQLQTDLDFYFNDPAGGFATTIYQGGAGDAPRVEVANGEVIAYSAKADEPAIRDLLRSLSSIVVAGEQAPSPDRNMALEAASSRLIEAGNGVTEIRARIGVSEERMQAALDRLEFEATALSAAYNDRTARDPFEAASRLQQLESQLQASFVLSSRISQLSLVNFLR